MKAPLIDTFGRVHNSLRISVTDRCNLRCFYCMPDEAIQFEPRAEILTFEEIERFTRIAASVGVRKLRISGGEPLVRRDLPLLIEKLRAIPGIDDLALTTNGVLLDKLAPALYEAGLRRLNVHLDTLDRERFRQIVRRDEFERVISGIDTAIRVGFRPLKINAVAVKDLTECEIAPLANFARARGIQVRFIEFMALDAQGLWDRSKVLTASAIRERIEREIGPLVQMPAKGPAPATEFRFADGRGSIGFIASVTQPFCESCNRLRITADGKLRYCLFAIDETDIKGLLRSDAPDERIEAAIRATVHAKWSGHSMQSSQFVPPPRPMYSIGG